MPVVPPDAAFVSAVVAVGSAIVLSTVGAVAGAIAAEPADRVATWESTFHTVVARVPVQQSLREQVLSIAGITGRPFVSTDGDGRSGPAASGANTVLELAVDEIALTNRETKSPWVPALWLTVTTKSRLVDRRTGATLYEQQLTYIGREPRHLKDWVSDDGRRIREELEGAYLPLADTIVSEIFLVYPIGSERK